MYSEIAYFIPYFRLLIEYLMYKDFSLVIFLTEYLLAIHNCKDYEYLMSVVGKYYL